MEYKNYEEWEADGQKIQADLDDAGRKLRQARIDFDDEAADQLEDEYHRLKKEAQDHMKKMPPAS